ncbi:tyrosine-protein kinase family protein [Ruegeria arenilitoris]|uniref:tyrosine-protein kinase family protein n=1 Tax=Ruegeria arenilitoris TaxID=1173585 RepID=UPI001C2BC47E|nr:CpsD/CapB family tyrosine-protein kinase [Ruegeria arenilitoris]
MIAQNARVTAELRQIERDARAIPLLQETFISRLEEAAVQLGAQTPDSRIISAATPGKQVAPRSGLIMFPRVFARAALGQGIVLVRQIRQSAVPIGADLELATSVPVLGRLPLAPIRQRSQLVGYLSTYPTSPLSEAARNLQTSVLSPYADAPPQVILCTSSVPDEGKTKMSIALAQSMAGLGRSVLLLEADIRSLSFRAYFPDNPNGGLVTALTGGTPLGNLLRTNTRFSVSVLMGERSTRSATDTFSSSRFHDLMQRLRADCDNILIDSPPVLAIPDARAIGQACDAIILSVAPATTSRAQLAQALREFSSVNLQVTVLVISDLGSARKQTKAGGQSYGAYARYYNVRLSSRRSSASCAGLRIPALSAGNARHLRW